MNITYFMAWIPSKLDGNIMQTSNIYTLRPWGKETQCPQCENGDETTSTYNKKHVGAKSPHNVHTDEPLRQCHSLISIIHFRIKRSYHLQHMNKDNASKTSPVIRKIWDPTPDQCFQSENLHQNLGSHLTHIFQAIGSKKTHQHNGSAHMEDPSCTKTTKNCSTGCTNWNQAM